MQYSVVVYHAYNESYFFILGSNIHMSCKDCRENSVNWNEQFSVSALCDDCGFDAKNITYYWKLYLVNASSKAVSESKYSHSERQSCNIYQDRLVCVFDTFEINCSCSFFQFCSAVVWI